MASRKGYSLNTKKRYRIKYHNILLLLIIIAAIYFGVKFFLNKDETQPPKEEIPPKVEEVTLINFDGYSTDKVSAFCQENNLTCKFEYVFNDDVEYDVFISHNKETAIKTDEEITFILSNGEEVSFAEEGYSDINDIVNPEALDVLVNKNNKLSSEYEPSDLRLPDVFVTKNNRVLRDEVATQVELMFAAAKEEGYTLGVASAYRSYLTQKGLYDNYAASNGSAKADTFSARPGHSEHQTGLALDYCIPSNGSCPITSSLKDSDEYQWMNQNMHQYGFILSFPEGNLQGYMFEPWHIRYVGTELAAYLYANNLTIDEYYKEGKNFRKPLN